MQYIAAITNPNQRAEVERWASLIDTVNPKHTSVNMWGLVIKQQMLSDVEGFSVHVWIAVVIHPYSGCTENSLEILAQNSIYTLLRDLFGISKWDTGYIWYFNISKLCQLQSANSLVLGVRFSIRQCSDLNYRSLLLSYHSYCSLK